MIDAAIKVVEERVARPFRTVLLKSAGLAVLFLVILGVALDRLLIWLSGAGGQWLEATLGSAAHWPVAVLGWAIAIVLGLGLVVGIIFLMPAGALLGAGVFFRRIAQLVERTRY